MSELGIRQDVPLAPFTTLELGGHAAHFVRIADEGSLVEALRWARDRTLPVGLLAGGSNLIVPDEGFPGLVVHVGIESLEIDDAGGMRVGAGTPWESVVERAVSEGWAGLECLTGIPGSAGATPVQNVGAYGQEVADVLESIRVVDRHTLAVEELGPADCALEYRNSMFKRNPERFIVTEVRLRLRPGGAPTLRYAELVRSVAPDASIVDVREAVLDLRRRKSMVIEPGDPNRRSAGSFFLNPVVPSPEATRIAEHALRIGLVDDAGQVPRYPVDEGRTKLAAGWLIEGAGFEKGTRRGPVGLSSRHALALVHHGGGTTAELLAFAEDIRRRVEHEFGIVLEREPRLLA